MQKDVEENPHKVLSTYEGKPADVPQSPSKSGDVEK